MGLRPVHGVIRIKKPGVKANNSKKVHLSRKSPQQSVFGVLVPSEGGNAKQVGMKVVGKIGVELQLEAL